MPSTRAPNTFREALSTFELCDLWQFQQNDVTERWSHTTLAASNKLNWNKMCMSCKPKPGGRVHPGWEEGERIG